ncbi:MAG: HAD-IC family P-type ATPase, partial [Candidatus Eisenbacteria bacterium]|nr:HAD-IC family P-type ATPase [Candidatus Eisenbacteria bacterium]
MTRNDRPSPDCFHPPDGEPAGGAGSNGGETARRDRGKSESSDVQSVGDGPQGTDGGEDTQRSARDELRKTLDELSTDPEQGLESKEARRRLREHGPNTIKEEERSRLQKLLSHFWGPIPWMIETAAALAAIAQRWEDFSVIFVMLLINGGVGFLHENKADQAIQALKAQLSPVARVVRDGEDREIAAEELVPGDIVILRMGDVVPADVRLLADQHLSLDESALTGESLPVGKEEGEESHSGTTVKRGEGRCVVTATGRETRFARTVELVESAEKVSHFQKAVLRIGYVLIGMTAVLVAVVV